MTQELSVNLAQDPRHQLTIKDLMTRYFKRDQVHLEQWSSLAQELKGLTELIGHRSSNFKTMALHSRASAGAWRRDT